MRDLSNLRLWFHWGSQSQPPVHAHGRQYTNLQSKCPYHRDTLILSAHLGDVSWQLNSHSDTSLSQCNSYIENSHLQGTLLKVLILVGAGKVVNKEATTTTKQISQMLQPGWGKKEGNSRKRIPRKITHPRKPFTVGCDLEQDGNVRVLWQS